MFQCVICCWMCQTSATSSSHCAVIRRCWAMSACLKSIRLLAQILVCYNSLLVFGLCRKTFICVSVFYSYRPMMICSASYWSSWSIMCSHWAWTVATGWPDQLWTILLAAGWWHISMSLAVASPPFVCPAFFPRSPCWNPLLLTWQQGLTQLSSVLRLWVRWAVCPSSDRHYWPRVMVLCRVVLNCASKDEIHRLCFSHHLSSYVDVYKNNNPSVWVDC